MSFKKGHTSDIRPATLSSWLKQTIPLCYKQADQQALDLVQVKVHDIRAFMVGYRWTKSCKPITGKLTAHLQIFCLKDLTLSVNDNNMYLGPVVAAQVLDPSPQSSYLRKEKKGEGTSATNKYSGV